MQAQSRIRKLIPSESTENENVYEEVFSIVPFIALLLASNSSFYRSTDKHFDEIFYLTKTLTKFQITSQVIISCGKGMEDFRDHTTSIASQSDHLQNSSYLIVWHYPVSDDNA